jgi:hypothetical protein
MSSLPLAGGDVWRGVTRHRHLIPYAVVRSRAWPVRRSVGAALVDAMTLAQPTDAAGFKDERASERGAALTLARDDLRACRERRQEHHLTPACVEQSGSRRPRREHPSWCSRSRRPGCSELKASRRGHHGRTLSQLSARGPARGRRGPPLRQHGLHFSGELVLARDVRVVAFFQRVGLTIQPLR